MIHTINNIDNHYVKSAETVFSIKTITVLTNAFYIGTMYEYMSWYTNFGSFFLSKNKLLFYFSGFVSKGHSGEGNQFIIHCKLQSSLVKCKNYTLTTSSANLPSISLYILHDSSNSRLPPISRSVFFIEIF